MSTALSIYIESLNASLEDLALDSVKILESSILVVPLPKSESSSNEEGFALSTALAQTFVSLTAAILGAKRAAFGVDAKLLEFAPTSQAAQSGGPLVSLSQLASFAKSVGCIYVDSLLKATGEPSDVAGVAAVNLLGYLASQVQVYRLYLTKKRAKRQSQDLLLSGHTSKSGSDEIAVAALLYSIARLVSVPVREVALLGGANNNNSNGESPSRLLAKIKAKVDWMLTKLPVSVLPTPERSAPLLDKSLATPEVMAALTEIHTALRDTYAVRRAMLLQRLDVTIQSFLWSRKAEGREAEITSAISSKRKSLISAPARISPVDAFEAPVFLAQWLCQRVTGDTSSSATGGGRGGASKGETFSFGVQKRNALKSVRIGAVPDRGGRVDEMKAPKAEMPSWLKRGEKKKEDGGGSDVQSVTAPSPPSARPGLTCFTCGQAGHKSSECKNSKRAGAAGAAAAADNGSMVDAEIIERKIREVTHTLPQVMLSGGSGSGKDNSHRVVDKAERGKEILRNAKQFEGEAGVALEEMEAEDAAGDDDNDDDNDDDDAVEMSTNSRNTNTQWVAPKKRKNRRRKGKGNGGSTNANPSQ
jgi:hypothetical protein